MSDSALIAGRAASLDEAIEAAAALLRRSSNVLFAGLDTDVAGVTAAIDLARCLGGAVDHRHASAARASQEAMRTSGCIVTTVLQTRARADLVLLAGDRLETDWPDLTSDLLLEAPPPLFPDRARAVLRLRESPADLAETLGAVRAELAGRAAAARKPGVATLAAAVRSARYGVIVWDCGALDTAGTAMLCGLVDDLNAHTRFAGLPMPPPGTVAGAMQAAAWLTGLPLPLGFAGPGGPAAHDPEHYDAARLVEAGEADAVVWIGADAPPWRRAVPTIALTPMPGGFAPEVTIRIGAAGHSHHAVMFDPRLGALAAVSATAPDPRPSCAEGIARLKTALGC